MSNELPVSDAIPVSGRTNCRRVQLAAGTLTRVDLELPLNVPCLIALTTVSADAVYYITTVDVSNRGIPIWMDSVTSGGKPSVIVTRKSGTVYAQNHATVSQNLMVVELR